MSILNIIEEFFRMVGRFSNNKTPAKNMHSTKDKYHTYKA